jgi:BMFP domain-containing protein YqiC
MNQEHDEQTRWLVSYLETRFGRLEDRISSVAEGLEDRLDQAIMAQSVKLDALEEKVNQLENDHLKLSNQAGLVRNLLAFIGTAMLSLLGWLASTFLYPPK